MRESPEETVEQVFVASTRIVLVVDKIREEGRGFDFLSTALIDAYVRMSRFYAKKTVPTSNLLRRLALTATEMAKDEEKQARKARARH